MRLRKSEVSRLFNGVVREYLNQYGVDLSHMGYKLSETPVYDSGRPVEDKPKGWAAGSWTSLGYVQINPDIDSVYKYWNLGNKDRNDFMRHIIAHELAHEVWNKSQSSFKRQILREAANYGKDNKYLKSVDKDAPDKKDEEKFCEYLASKIAGSGL